MLTNLIDGRVWVGAASRGDKWRSHFQNVGASIKVAAV
jgi:hypothetical protein